MKIKLLFFAIVASLFSISAYSEEQEQSLSIERIFSREFSANGVSSVRWMDDNVSYSFLQWNKELKGTDIVRYDVKSGKTKVIVSASLLVPKGQEKPLGIDNYSWSEDHSKLLIYTNSSRVWRDNTRGDYWVLDMVDNELSQVANDKEPSRLMFCKFSPDASNVAYVYYNNIYVENLESKEEKQLTFDGSDVIINGNFDWVYEEELGIQDGFRWSPDGKTIAFWHSDTEGTGVFKIINNIDSVYSTVQEFPYPKVGTTNSAVKVGAVNIASGETSFFEIPGDPRNNYLARMDFIPNSDELMIQQLNRLQNQNTVYVGDVSDMSVEVLLEDSDEAFLNIHDNIVWLDKEKYFTWTSEKDGWRHLYKVSRDGKEETLITKGEFDVISIYCIDTKGGYVYYAATPESNVEKYLYRSRLDGKGEAVRVSPEGFVGHHSYMISGNAKYALHIYNNSATPSTYELISLPKHKTVRVLEDNKSLKDKMTNLALSPKEWLKVDIGEVELDAWMIKPANFDPSKKYPIIFYIYGEPASSTVQNVWSSRDLWNHYLAQQGYIVMSVDPRGSNNPRGREWRKSVYGKLGIIPPADHAAAVQKLVETYSFIDASRVGIWGWSGGGTSTMNAMFKHPDIYSTGIAVAGVSRYDIYDTIYQERYMGLPSTNPEGYFNGSPINFVSGLEGNLMIIHGTGDDNVHYQSCEMVVNELVKQGKIFSMMAYPMRAHGIYERKGTTQHLYKTMLKYWVENLPAGAR